MKTAASVDEAVSLLETKRFDVVLCDNKMPRRSGEELVDEVRTRWPSTFIVSVTGAASEKTARRMLEEGPYYYLPKPFRLSRISEILEVVRSEIEFRSRVAPARPLEEVISGLLADGLTVGLIGGDSASTRPGVTVLPEVSPNSSGIPEPIAEFLGRSSQTSLVLLATDDWVRRTGRSHTLEIVRLLRARMSGVGPLLVALEGEALSQRDVLVMREALSFPTVPLEGFGIAGRQRRSIVRSLSSGPKRAPALLEALTAEEADAGVYFLENLVAHHLVELHDGLYRLTHDGEKAAQAIFEIERSPSVAPGGSRLFTIAG